MSLHNLVADGGKILVVGGMPKNWQEYRNHPQLEFWSGEAGEILGVVKSKTQNGIPANVKGIIVSRFIPHSVQDLLLPEARKRKIVYFPQKNDGEITKLLDEITSELPKAEAADEKTTRAPFGSVKKLIEEFDDIKLSGADSARKILDIARERGLKTTTYNSLSVQILSHRRKKGLTNKPASISKPKSSLQTLLNAFDDAIAGLQLAREAAVQISKENDELKTYKEKVSKILDGLK